MTPPRPLVEDLCTLWGLSLNRQAPGTWGSGAALLAGVVIITLSGSIGLILATFALLFIGIWACDQYEALTGRHDSSEIIIDEVAGQWIAMVPLPIFGADWYWYPVAFGLFRLFDILKPGPIGKLDSSLPGGFGTMADDLAAGLCAAVLLWILI
jgi:phosphatidylglycerophosphatase A